MTRYIARSDVGVGVFETFPDGYSLTLNTKEQPMDPAIENASKWIGEQKRNTTLTPNGFATLSAEKKQAVTVWLSELGHKLNDVTEINIGGTFGNSAFVHTRHIHRDVTPFPLPLPFPEHYAS